MLFSTITRSMRFIVLEGLLVHFFGAKAKELLDEYLEIALVAFLALVILGIAAVIYL
jgi:hypothetical protein